MSSYFTGFAAGRLILFALLCTILIGTALLALPISRHVSMSFIDLFFTSTSVTCVTGILTVPIEQFTFFGHCVILGLIQIGGLGIITLTLFLLSLFVNLGLSTQFMAGRLLELESWKNIRELLLFIIATALLVELLGMLAFLSVFAREHAFGHALFLAIFHAVSCFCNAGITLFGNSLQLYAHNYVVIITAAILMLCGGIGFITIYELVHYIKNMRMKKHPHFSLQTKIVLYGSLMGIMLIASLVYLLEKDHAFVSLSPLGAIITSIFQAISFRSTGLLTVPVADLLYATLFLIMITSFIGSAPGSTGSGIRTTTLAIYMAVVKAAIEARTGINMLGRRLAKDQINKAIAIISLSIFWVMLTLFCLLIIEPQFRFIELLFEVMGAFTNLGLSLGITAHLSILAKTLIIFTMMIGRIGSLTLILALRKIALKKGTALDNITYPEERIMLS